MRHRVAILTVVVLSAGLLLAAAIRPATPSPFRARTCPGGRLTFIENVPVLSLAGSPADIGRQRQTLLADVSGQVLPLARAVLGEREVGWAEAVAFSRQALGRVPARFRQEIEAMIETAGADAATAEAIMVVNLLAELRRAGCSVFLVEPQRSATGATLFGRNMDYATFGQLDRMSLVTICRPQGYHAFASVDFAGMMGVVTGINDAGLAIATLDSGPAADGSQAFNPQGVPLLLTFRRILEECESVDDAQRLLEGTSHTTWMNLACCDRQKAVVFEITSKQVVTRRAEDHLLAATNHFRAAPLAVGNKACGRYAKLQKRWGQSEPFTWHDVAAAMHAARQDRTTLQSMVFEPASLRLRLAIGSPPASARPMVTLDLASLFRQPAAAVRVVP